MELILSLKTLTVNSLNNQYLGAKYVFRKSYEYTFVKYLFG